MPKSPILNFFSFDQSSLVLILLSAIIIPLCLIYNFYYINFSFKLYIILILFLEYIIILAFLINHLLIFYFLFETLLLPMFLLIGLWGSRGRKAHAAYLFFFYTIFSSILLILGIIIIYLEGGSLFFTDFNYIKFDKTTQIIIGLLFFFGFSAKIPSFPLHVWLPEAHVEAPTVGSVILAAILLKFGFYGMLKVIIPICDAEVYLYLRPIFILICSLSLIYASFSAIRQIDLKKMIAYSSIVHMNIAMLGLFLSSVNGLSGSLFLMVSHGFISAGMFFCIGFLYERFHTRNIIYFGGLSQVMPIFSFYFFFIIFSNMSLPGTCNFIGELLIFLSLYKTGLFLLICGLSSAILVAIFCLALLARVNFYQITGFLKQNLFDINIGEFIILFILSTYILILGLIPNIILSLFNFF